MLLRAYQRYEDEISDVSGLGMFIARTTDPNVRFDVRERVDQAAAELEKWDAAHSGKKKVPGMTRYAVPVDVITGKDLDFGGLERDQFFEQARKDADLLAKALEGRGGVEEEVEPGVFIERLAPGQKYNPDEYGDGAVTSEQPADPDPQK